MLQRDGVIVLETPEQFEQALALIFGGDSADAQPEESSNPFDTHAANLESLADAVKAGMEKIATQSGIPEDLTDDMVPASLLETERSLSTALALAAISLRMQAAEWRKAGAKI